MDGMVFDIQRFSIHDGPGIRTTVFLKGCNLRCLWCHNPESLHAYPEVEIYPDKCIGCGRCIEVCTAKVIGVVEGNAQFDRAACLHCGKCTEECFAGARVLAGKRMTVEEVMAVVERDHAFYKNSSGGVTFSGGEPMLQKDFLIGLLKECKKRGIHTAVDTAGNLPWETIEEVAASAALFLYDMKAMDSVIHKKATGAGNERILENLKKLAAGKVDMIIRIPVIPGINDFIENMEAASDFLSGLKGIKQVELLSFHLLGEAKYESLGMEYKAKNFKLLPQEEVQRLSQPFTAGGLPVKIF